MIGSLPKLVEEEALAVAPTAKSRKLEKVYVALFLNDSGENEDVERISRDVPASVTPKAPTASDEYTKYLVLPRCS
ncbi:hypothetical protein CYMTET_15702 [Cymbomonas tetramitiformis]|uniref:Uncharacterized protein n=1 Tax=Cymbomonas tetramitiformis TaxID=36881 RepID=A0AAE0GF00_9CHLO|nr:hypothetical protein CYMTET_15702 [Cymbomonas tetramitiformis]